MENPQFSLGEVVPMLFVSAASEDHIAMRAILADTKWKLIPACSCAQAFALARSFQIPVVLCDREIADGTWISLHRQLSELSSPPVTVVTSAVPSERLWAEVLNLGAYDLLEKPFRADEVLRVSFNAWQTWKLHANRRDPRAAVAIATK